MIFLRGEMFHMLGIYLFCLCVFPLLILFPLKSVSDKEVLLDKEDAEILKGVAACFIILAHLIIPIKAEAGIISSVLNIYTFTGGMGVLIFFFISGYGIYKGYGKSEFTIKFWYKRIFFMYLPSVMIQFVFSVIDRLKNDNFLIKEIVFDMFVGAWFIDVIMLQYLIFFIAWKVSKGRQNILIILSFLGSIIAAVAFYIMGFNPRWYNGLLLFPVGMLIAFKEKELTIIFRQRWLACLSIFTIAFMILGGIFVYGKGNYIGIDMCKTLAGICLSACICIFFVRIKLYSSIMRYIGRRSLFYYLIHLNLLEICESICTSSVKNFYVVMLLTPFVVGIIYKPYSFCFQKTRK